MSDKKDEKDSGDGLAHRPMPYYVRLRCVVDEDRPAEVREFKAMWAYSVTEALMQAILEAGGETPSAIGKDKRITLESIRPDLEAYGNAHGRLPAVFTR